MLKVGDIIERTGGRSKYTTGRVTGFSPNGRHAHVQVAVGSRIWPKEELKVRMPADLAELQRLDAERRELLLLIEARDFIERHGEERTRKLLDLLARYRE